MKKLIVFFFAFVCMLAVFSVSASASDRPEVQAREATLVASSVYGESKREALEAANAQVESGRTPDSLTYFAQGAKYRTVEDGYYTIEAAETDVCFNVDSDGANSDYEGISITVWETTDDVTQRFRIVMNEDGTYSIYAACSRGGYDRAVGYNSKNGHIGLYSEGSASRATFYIKNADESGISKYIVLSSDETKYLGFTYDYINGTEVFLCSPDEEGVICRWNFGVWGNISVNGVEKAVYPGNLMLVTQAPFEEYSHGTQNATDVQVNKGDSFFAPFTCKVAAINEACGNVVWIQSLSKVLYADGSYDYMTVLFMHDNDISDIYIGEILLKGQAFYEMGTAGYADGAHVHISCYRGEYSPSMKISNLDENAVNIWDAFFVPVGIEVKDDYGFAWVYDSE